MAVLVGLVSIVAVLLGIYFQFLKPEIAGTKKECLDAIDRSSTALRRDISALDRKVDSGLQDLSGRVTKEVDTVRGEVAETRKDIREVRTVLLRSPAAIPAPETQQKQ